MGDPAQPALFDRPPGSPLPKVRKPVAPGVVKYTKYRPRVRVLCADCITDIHERGWLVAPAARGSVWRGRTCDGDVITLCDAHYRSRRGDAS